mgnify:CR=1 FL=1
MCGAERLRRHERSGRKPSRANYLPCSDCLGTQESAPVCDLTYRVTVQYMVGWLQYVPCWFLILHSVHAGVLSIPYRYLACVDGHTAGTRTGVP